MADEPAAGTPEATPEGAVTDSGTPGASPDGSGAVTVDADELKRLRNTHDQFLREKDNTERIRQENEFLRQRVEQANRAIAPPTGYDPAAQRVNRAAQLLQSIGERDPEVAQAITEIVGLSHEETQSTLHRQQAEQRFYRELGGVPSEDQSEVEKLARADNLWPSVAHDRLKSRRYDKERSELAEQRRKLQEQEDRLKRGVVKTTAEPAPLSSSKTDEITTTEYDRIIAAASRGDREARKKLDDVENDVVRVRPG
ncbi:MAG TPA: hypothetical protein VK754_00260 [Propionibacteriaceae bacterium]|nr:hypothetical protein [Propionibacteriaceae bacterium]